MDVLIKDITHPAESAGTLISLLGFTTVFFFVYWWFREQACIVVCPYGRLQGVLLDKNSIVVAYDYLRGEPRGKAAGVNEREVAPYPKVKLGDCIDCEACVRVCPTGIDIRNGTQLECVNCTACIDACDAIMTGIKKPTGLIRYASENSIKDSVKLKFTGRIKAYSVVLFLLMSLLVFLLVSRTDLDARLMRTSGMTYNSLPDGRIANLYSLKLVNKTHLDIPFSLKLENHPGEISFVGSSDLIVKKEAYNTLQFFVKLNRTEIKSWKTEIQIALYQNNIKLKTITAKFIGPEVYN
jgi:cytochrome c oxidase accessory protein FixG